MHKGERNINNKRGDVMVTIQKYTFLITVAVVIFFCVPQLTFAKSNINDIKIRVEAALHPYYTDDFDLSVDENGKVVIKGDVDTYYDKLNIYEIVSKVKGVTKIEDLVDVDTPKIPDDMINANIVRTIKDNSTILEPDKIAVKVTDGFVFLKGTASYPKEKLMAETLSSWQDGVMGIENEIHILSPKEARSDENIKSVIMEIIENHFPLVKNTVNVRVNGGDVALNGEIGSLWEKVNLKKECVNIMGVKSVVENLTITPHKSIL
jgi:osmotically-inducible protein OsmY